MTAARALRILIQVAVSGGLLYWVFRGVNLERTLSFIGRADPLWLSGGIVFLFAAVLLKSLRLRYILMGVRAIPVASIFSSSIIGSMFNASLPAKSGNLVFAHWLGKKNTISRATSLSAILLSQLIDGGVLVCAAPILAYFVLPETGLFRPVLWAAAGTVILFLGVLVGFAYQRDRVGRWIRRIVGPLFPSCAEILADKAVLFTEGLGIVKEKGRLANLMLMSVPVVLSYLLRIYLILMAMGVTVSAAAVVVVWVFANVGTLAPSFVANIGPYEFMVVIALKIFGVEEDAALAAALVLHFLLLAPVILAGLISVWHDRFLVRKSVG